MRIVIITSEEPFYLPRFIDRILERRGGDVVAVVVPTSAYRGKSLRSTILRYLAFYGPVEFGKQAARLAATRGLQLATRIAGRRDHRSVIGVARRRGVALRSPRNVNDPEFLAELRELAPDVIVSVSAAQIFRSELLSLPPRGCVNVHSALLPRYRGLHPTFWVLANGEAETGVTVHYMDEKLDNGPILVQRSIPIEQSDTHHSLIVRTKELGAELLLQALDQIEHGTVRTRENDERLATSFSFPTREAVRGFRARGRRFR